MNKEIIDYLNLLKINKEKHLEDANFASVPSVAISLEYDINALKTVIDIVKNQTELDFV